MMGAEQAIKLERIKRRVEAADADLSGSTFTDVNLAGAAFDDVNLAGATINNAALSGLRISDANLSGAAIVQCAMDEMTINGISLSALLAAYQAVHPKGA
jgi:uncharacterized protein YjbI with pentapeptide repeats